LLELAVAAAWILGETLMEVGGKVLGKAELRGIFLFFS
jgi:hypothetical protein